MLSDFYGRNGRIMLKSEEIIDEGRCSECVNKLSCSRCPHRSNFYQKELENFFMKIEDLKKKNSNTEEINEGSTSLKV